METGLQWPKEPSLRHNAKEKNSVSLAFTEEVRGHVYLFRLVLSRHWRHWSLWGNPESLWEEGVIVSPLDGFHFSQFFLKKLNIVSKAPAWRLEMETLLKWGRGVIIQSDFLITKNYDFRITRCETEEPREDEQLYRSWLWRQTFLPVSSALSAISHFVVKMWYESCCLPAHWSLLKFLQNIRALKLHPKEN